MRRFFALLAVGLLLSSCRGAGGLPPDDVLRRATSASATLQSARFEVEIGVSARMPDLVANVSANVRGTLAHGGQQTAFAADANGTVTREGTQTSFTTVLDAVTDVQDAYVRLRSLTLSPTSQGLTGSQSLLNTWWKISRQEGGLPIQPLTPDPQFLRAEAEAVTVTRDRGIESVDGSDAYRYDVTLDPEKLVTLLRQMAEEKGQPFEAERARRELAGYTATGELWVDAKTFVVRRLTWTIESAPDPSAFRLTFRATLRDHDAAPAIEAPAGAQSADSVPLLRQLAPFISAP